MVEVLFNLARFDINGVKVVTWFAIIDGVPVLFDTKEQAIDWCSEHDLTCGFMDPAVI